MTQIMMVKGLGVLRPGDDVAAEALRRIKFGDTIAVEIKRPRNIRFHRLYWGLVALVFENQSEPARYASTEDLHGAIKIAAGLRTQIELPGGIIGYMPGSIAFHKMSADDFAAFYDRVCDLVAKHFLPGVTSEDLKREVESMIGASAA
jgi:hypothetical protein